MPEDTQMQTPPTTTQSPARPGNKGGAGATVGIIIIVVLMIFGGLYFWGARLNAKQAQVLPLIPADNSAQQ